MFIPYLFYLQCQHVFPQQPNTQYRHIRNPTEVEHGQCGLQLEYLICRTPHE